ncbi:MAG: hypothetical protein HKP30_15215, partial [Myxococcales bacterium]|nr:hypothetical protein [Myxococcales bacterium]
MRALRLVAFALFPTLLLFGVFSLGFLGEPENDPWLTASPLWGPGDPFYFEEHELAHNLADPILIWRGRPNFEASYQYLVLNPYRHNEYGFRDAPIADPKPEGVVRVLNLGDSSTWGLNLPEQEATYSDQLQRLLDEQAAGAYDVVNAGVVGYSSFQGLQLLRLWLDELDADVVSIYLGNNDPAPSSVKDVDRVAATAGPLHDALYRNRFYLLLVKGFQSLRAAGIDRERRRLGSLSEDQRLEDYYRESARVSPDEFEANLRGMVSVVREQGARPILLKVPMNLAWPHRVQPYVEQILRPDRFWGTVKIEPGYLVRVRSGKPPCFGEGLVGHPYLCRITTLDLEKARLPDAETLEEKAADPALGERARLWAAHNRAVWELAGG